MRILSFLLKTLLIFPVIALLILGVLFSLTVGVILFMVTGRKIARFQVFRATPPTSDGPSPMRDVTPKQIRPADAHPS